MKILKGSIKLIWPHLVVLLLFMAGSIISILSFTTIKTQMEALYRQSFAVRCAAGSVNEAFEKIQTSVLLAILNDAKGSDGTAVSEVRNSMKMIEEQVSLIKLNTIENAASISRLEKYLTELTPMQEHVLKLIDQKENEQAAAYMESSNIPVIQGAQTELAMLIQSAEENENELVESLRQTQRNAAILLIALGVASVLFSVWVGIYILQLQKRGRKNILQSTW